MDFLGTAVNNHTFYAPKQYTLLYFGLIKNVIGPDDIKFLKLFLTNKYTPYISY